MKRLRPGRWSAQLLVARPGARALASSSANLPIARRPFLDAPVAASRCLSSSAATPTATTPEGIDELPVDQLRISLPSPPPHRAAESAKLAALHARLSLSRKIPFETLARALVTPSADRNANFNNASLAKLGRTIINYHVLEYLLCKWPRLPMVILYEALRAYAGAESLEQVARRWGVEAAAAPGEEVDAGFLQWSTSIDTDATSDSAYVRAEAGANEHYRRGISSRVVLDDEFGDTARLSKDISESYVASQTEAFSSFTQALVGSIYAHCGRESAKTFVKSHILSRQIDPSTFFHFQLPTRELAMLCAREGFAAPTARLESETGRLSRTPVFVVGVYSGNEKLGEGSGANLDFARRKASMNALKSWYLYSPGNKVRVPSDMIEKDAAPWTAPHIDPGEIV